MSLFAKFMENITGNVTNLWHVTKHIFAPNQDHPTYPPSRWCVFFFFWRLPHPGNGIAITTSTNVTETFDYSGVSQQQIAVLPSPWKSWHQNPFVSQTLVETPEFKKKTFALMMPFWPTKGTIISGNIGHNRLIVKSLKIFCDNITILTSFPQIQPSNIAQMILWSSGKGQARIGKGWQSRWKASKLKPLPRA